MASNAIDFAVDEAMLDLENRHDFNIFLAKKGTSTRRQQDAMRVGMRSTVYSLDGSNYKGEWKSDAEGGKGVKVWKNGDKYEGEWLYGVRHGYGTFWKIENKQRRKVYIGGWKRDQMSGYGTYFYHNGDRYEGEWKNNHKNGWGTMVYENGDQYQGEWSNELPHGFGTYIKANSDRYEGEWSDGKKHGKGIYFYIQRNQRYDGQWQDDIPKCGAMSEIDEDPDLMSDDMAARLPQAGLRDADGVLEDSLQRLRRLAAGTAGSSRGQSAQDGRGSASEGRYQPRIEDDNVNGDMEAEGDEAAVYGVHGDDDVQWASENTPLEQGMTDEVPPGLEG